MGENENEQNGHNLQKQHNNLESSLANNTILLAQLFSHHFKNFEKAIDIAQVEQLGETEMAPSSDSVIFSFLSKLINEPIMRHGETVTCNSGIQERRRSCHLSRSDSSRGCAGPGEEIRACTTNIICNVDGGWSHWESWSLCCDGLHDRHRECNNPTPKGNGQHCHGVTTESRRCQSDKLQCEEYYRDKKSGVGEENEHKIKTKHQHKHQVSEARRNIFQGNKKTTLGKHSIQKIPNLWSDWEPWSSCSVSCSSGVQTRRRACHLKSTLNVMNCIGPGEELKTCNAGPCYNLIKTGWADWSAWSECSLDCGQGQRFRFRRCQSESCPGAWIGMSECLVKDCENTTSTTEHHNSLNFQVNNLARFVDELGTGQKDNEHDAEGLMELLQNILMNNTALLAKLLSNHLKEVEQVVNDAKAGHTIGDTTSAHDRFIYLLSGLINKPTEEPITDIVETTTSESPHTFAVLNQLEEILKTPKHEPLAERVPTLPNHPKTTTIVTTPALPETTTIVLPQWGNWEPWSPCSASCSSGTEARRRFCDHTNTAKFLRCVGFGEEVKKCNAGPCNVDGGWSEWTKWTPCCDGIQDRHRECDNPVPKGNGQRCNGPIIETLDCEDDLCDVYDDEGWSDWSSWTSCCDGLRERTRHCRTKDKPCDGHEVDTEDCDNDDDDDDNGDDVDKCLKEPTEPNLTKSRWSEWLPWSPCSNSCGFGNRTRSHTCTTPSIINSQSSPCGDFYKQTEDCHGNTSCPETGTSNIDNIQHMLQKSEVSLQYVGIFMVIVCSVCLLLLCFIICKLRDRRRKRKLYRSIPGSDPNMIDWLSSD
ncbi:uncharacterized protein LOC144451188 [Glandiceps talaboti]